MNIELHLDNCSGGTLSNRLIVPHGIAFNKITNGVIRDMKIWKVMIISGGNYIHFLNSFSKPIGWNFATSGLD